MINHLIEGLSRVQRDLSRRGITLRHLLFLRSDIYERLVEETSDRGKYNPIKVDWSDPHQLRYLIRERVITSVSADLQGDAWKAINPTMDGGDTISLLIENSLRRPRFLIDLCERTVSCAINRGHAFVQPEDIEEGLRQMALYLVSDFAYEMRDVSGTPENLLYAFIGAQALLSGADISTIVGDRNFGMSTQDIIELPLWYGFLGILIETLKPLFIYDVEYDFRRSEAERLRLQSDAIYVVNPAFLKGLSRAM